MVYKYPRAQKFFDSPLSTHFGEEVHELLVVDVEFPGLEMVKIKAFLSFDNLLAMLEERHLSNWDVPASLEWYIEEIGGNRDPSRFSGSIHVRGSGTCSRNDHTFNNEAGRAYDRANFDSPTTIGVRGTYS